MNKERLSLARLCFVVDAVVFYAFNFYKFKKLAFKSCVIRPLRLDGRCYMSIGEHVRVQALTWLAAIKIDAQDPELVIGDGCGIGDFNHITAVRSVVIGKNVLTGNGVYIADNSHGFDDVNVPVMHQPVVFKGAVRIGDGSWIGEHACIIGVNVGRHCIIGANAVVTHDIPDHCVAVGAPARVIKKYDHAARQWLSV
ncbi:MAG: acyltransferase [Candidatus Omnitrophota bacterium]